MTTPTVIETVRMGNAVGSQTAVEEATPSTLSGDRGERGAPETDAGLRRRDHSDLRSHEHE